MQKPARKQATRGQKQIHDENQSTITHYSLASAFSSLLCLILNLFLFESTSGTWTGWTFSTLLQLIAVGTMYLMVKSIKNERNQVIDAGLDLNDPQAFGEYCKDTVILCLGAHFLSLIWTKFYWILILLPAFAIFKLWTKILEPWFFAQPDEDNENSDKKQKKREKKTFIRR